MPTLISSQFKGPSNTNDGTMVVIPLENHPNDSRVRISKDDVYQTMNSRMGTGGNSEPMLMTFTKTGHPMNDTMPQGYEPTDVAKTLNTFNTGEARAEELIASKTFAIDQGGGKSSCNVSEEVSPTETTTHQGEPVVNHMHYAVRRITPIEGERLQGFADNWTRPCFKPEDITDELCKRFVEIHRQWAIINGDENPKPKSIDAVRKWLLNISSEQCPDGPRYKAIGNSMSVNVMMWIGERIQMVENEIKKGLV